MIIWIAILFLCVGFLAGNVCAIWYVIQKLETHEAYVNDAGGLAWRVRE